LAFKIAQISVVTTIRQVFACPSSNNSKQHREFTDALALQYDKKIREIIKQLTFFFRLSNLKFIEV